MLKRTIASMLALAAMTTFTGCNNSSSSHLGTDNQKNSNNQSENIDIKKVSEALGNFIGKNLKTPGLDFDVDSLVKGIKDGAAGKPSPMDEKEYEQAMLKLQQRALETIATKNLSEANAFMQKNAKEAGIVELIPGKLNYIVVQEGSGPAVEENGTPQIKYTGKYIDGTVFGSSEPTGGPISVPLDQTIPGFGKGIKGMKEGEKRRLFVHPDVGYGTTGQLPPNSLLIFDVEVIKAVSPDAKAETPAATPATTQHATPAPKSGTDAAKPAAEQPKK